MFPYRFYPPHYMPRIPYPPPNMPPIPPVPPSGFETFLKSTGQLMKTAQTYAPYVQQAMPMFKNLPTLFRLYKSFQQTPLDSSSSPLRTRTKPPAAPVAPLQTKPSLPKIYQP